MVFSHDLREFILRARVLKLYRQGLRTARKAPVDGRGKALFNGILWWLCVVVVEISWIGFDDTGTDELRHMMREEMEKNRKCNDRQKIRFLLSEGIERLKQLDEMLDMQGH